MSPLRRTIVAALVGALASTATVAARADDAPKQDAPKEEPAKTEPAKTEPADPAKAPDQGFQTNVKTNLPKRWYGWQIMLCDAAVVPQAIFAIKETSTILYVTGGMTYVVCPLAVHMFLHPQENAGWSGGARIVTPAVLAGIGYIVGYAFPLPKKEGDSPSTYGALTGTAIGVGAAVLFDWFWVSREEIPLWERLGMRVRPYTDGRTGGLAGTF